MTTRRVRCPAARASAWMICWVMSASAASGQLLTRHDAVSALLDPASGVVFDPTVAAVWCPYEDFGFGPDYRGLLPAGTFIEPDVYEDPPAPPPGMTLASDAYFFWFDDEQPAMFAHAVRYVLVDANTPNPTVFNGGILLLDQDWYPEITFVDGTSRVLFETIFERVTDDPPGPDNPQGLIAGVAPEFGDIVDLPDPSPLPPPRVSNPRHCALLIRGHEDKMFENDLKRWETDLHQIYGVPAGRIIKAADGQPATCKDIDRAIEALCALEDCDKIIIRITTHGKKSDAGGGFLQVAKDDNCEDKLKSDELCRKLKRVAAKGVPICLMINACHSGSLLDKHNWDFPAGSLIITVAKRDKCGWGGAYKDVTTGDGPITEGLYPHAFSKCLRNRDADANGDDRVDDSEAHDWVVRVNPCYEYEGRMYYPTSPAPEKRIVGGKPTHTVLLVCNSTDQPKTDFHWVFKGRVTGGKAKATKKRPGGTSEGRWAEEKGQTTITYDEEKDETMVCWMDVDDPILPGKYVEFSYKLKSDELKPIRQYWTPTSEPPEAKDRAPGAEGSAAPSGEQRSFDTRVIHRGLESGGWGVPIVATVYYRAAPRELGDDELGIGEPAFESLPRVPVGKFILLPDEPADFLTKLPDLAGQRGALILELHLLWDLNGNAAVQLMQFGQVLRAMPGQRFD